MELYDAMRTTPATRNFTDEPVDPGVLYRILDHARFAPSGSNVQGWQVIVVRDAAIRERLRDLYVLGWREYVAHVAAGFRPFAPITDEKWAGPAVDLEVARRTPAPNDFADHLDQHPVVLIVTVELGGLACVDNGLDRQSFVGGGSIYPFTHNLLLAARNEGLGGVMTTVVCRQEPAVKELLGIPKGHAVAAMVVLGHPVKTVTKLRRKPVEDFAVVDRYDGPTFAG